MLISARSIITFILHHTTRFDDFTDDTGMASESTVDAAHATGTSTAGMDR